MYDTTRFYDDIATHEVCGARFSTIPEKEERANAWGRMVLGLAFSVVGLVVLTLYSLSQRNWTAFVCCGIFGLNKWMVMTYAASMFYHSATREERKRLLQVWDHVCIYLLIADSYTPIAVLGLKGWWGWALLSFAWSFAVIGIAMKVLIKRRYHFVETMLYLLMVWAAMVVIVPLFVGPGISSGSGVEGRHFPWKCRFL